MSKEQKTRDKIVDAAEQLFSARGFYGTTTREITREAGVPLGLMSYYFGTKVDLYAEVINRRAEEHAKAILVAIDQAEKGKDGHPGTVADLIRAFFEPLVIRAMHSGPGWKAYIHLLARAANTPRSEPYVEAFDATYNPVVHAFVDLLKKHFPDASEENIYWCYYFLSSSIIHILVESGSIDEMSEGLLRSDDLETIMDKMAPFFEAGMNRLATGDQT